MYYLIIITTIQVCYLYSISSKNNLKPISIVYLILIAFIKTPFYSLIDDLLYLFFIAWPVVALMGWIIIGSNIRKIIEISFFVELMTALSYYFSGGILMFFNISSFEQIYNYNIIIEKNSLILAILSGLILSISLLLFRLFEFHKILYSNDNGINGIMIILGLNIIFKLMYEIQEYDGLMYIFYVIINIIVLILYISSRSLRYRKEIRERDILQKESIIRELSGYIGTIEDLSKQIEDLKHDYKNIVLGTSPDKINEIFSKFEKNLNSVNGHELFINIKYIDNYTVKSLLYYYIISAIKKGIKVKLDVVGSITKIDLAEDDLSRLLGILFENAVEESINSNEKLIEIYIENVNEIINITISNSINNTDIDIKDIFQRGYSNKGINRGIGLSVVDKINNNNSNLNIYTSILKNMFTQELYIKNKELN